MSARKISIGVGVVLIALISLFAFGGVSDDTPTSTLLGKRVPAIAALSMDGDDYDIDDFRGQWVLVNFFATWCPPCIQEHPDLVALEAWGAENQELDVVSVVFNDTPENVAQFFEDRGGAWPVLADPEIAVAFKIRKIPESFLVDPDGRIVAHYTGGVTAEAVQNAIAS